MRGSGKTAWPSAASSMPSIVLLFNDCSSSASTSSDNREAPSAPDSWEGGELGAGWEWEIAKEEGEADATEMLFGGLLTAEAGICFATATANPEGADEEEGVA